MLTALTKALTFLTFPARDHRDFYQKSMPWQLLSLSASDGCGTCSMLLKGISASFPGIQNKQAIDIAILRPNAKRQGKLVVFIRSMDGGLDQYDEVVEFLTPEGM